MIRTTISSILNPAELSHRILLANSLPVVVIQYRGRRRTTTPPHWVPPVYEKNRELMLDEENRDLIKQVIEAERKVAVKTTVSNLSEIQASMAEINSCTRRTGLLARKIGMLPQWTTTGDRILCTLLEVAENHVVSVTSPDEWYRRSIIGKYKAFGRAGPMWKVTVGAIDGDIYKFTHAYRNQFVRAGVPVKHHLGSFLVSEDAVPSVGIPLDARHFTVGQFVTATGKTIDWGFQGGMHRWGMRGQPARRTTKSHRRIGSVGSTGDARIWPGKRMPGHMGHEWVTISGLQILRINIDDQVIYIKGNVPGEVGDIIQIKDCLQPEKRLKIAPIPTWSPGLETIGEQPEDVSTVPKELLPNEIFSSTLFRFASPSLVFTDADAKKSTGRDKTKAKIAKVKK